MAFTTLMLFQVFNTFNARSEVHSAFRGLFRNRWLWAAVSVSVALHMLVIYVPFLQAAFRTVRLDGWDWARSIIVASSVLWIAEAAKYPSRPHQALIDRLSRIHCQHHERRLASQTSTTTGPLRIRSGRSM